MVYAIYFPTFRHGSLVLIENSARKRAPYN